MRDRAAGLAGALFEEGRGRGAARIGLSTGFLEAMEERQAKLIGPTRTAACTDECPTLKIPGTGRLDWSSPAQ